ncbi:hypothetical protein IJJ36_04390 [Candidatus Saccharibacteria bacterium]|nr:hypothetical protein [Candidatus Saccharibacteria bacterium]
MVTKKKTSTRTARSTKASGFSRNMAYKSKKSKSQNIAIFALAATVLFMSVGFAAYATTLNIGGTNNVTVKKAVWDIHWAGKSGASPAETGTVTETKGADLGEVTRASDTSVTFTATLQKPGDEYEFTVDAVNAGTFNAGLTSVVLSDASAHANYLTYTVNYDSQTFDGTSGTTSFTPSPASTLAAGAQKTATVNVKYIQPSNENQLPKDGDVTVTLTAAFNYDQITN